MIMVKIWIDSDEWYPVYSFSLENNTYGKSNNMTKKEIKKIQKVFDEFSKIQERLKKLSGE